MPVTVRPSSKTAESWGNRCGPSDIKYTHATSADQLLACTVTNDNESPFLSLNLAGGGSETRDGKPSRPGGGRRSPPPPLIQSSFAGLNRASSTTFATKNGFVHTSIEAYNEHHHLVLRPEDVWFAILTQLSVYINANADNLQHRLVTPPSSSSSSSSSTTSPDGKEALHIDVPLEGLDHGLLAYQMAKLLSTRLQDPSLLDFILPAFSTTTKADQTVASVILLGTMQKYFSYSWGTRCGIPSVTLLGEVEDWELMAARCADRLGAGGDFGAAPARWYFRLLRPVLAGFVETFRDPEGRAAKQFWKGIVDRHTPDGSGCVTYSGWITAFCYWDENGRCLHDTATNIGGGGRGGRGGAQMQMPHKQQTVGVELSRGQMPVGFTKVPVTLVDDGVVIPTEMVAGSVGLRVRRSVEGDGEAEETAGAGDALRARVRWDGFDTVQPESGWFMYHV
ncbi:hypothetical protein B0T19DRAFT_140629 [Cercophora scortea]|uniref:Uncharacterized protein n=1 Tax=Cercophora scortea TaxID=314031 RepID=A0AAE0IZ05_9PEZI|nr:hypothetical protein B0T19DRAFT_140629 [Cercophora scortea]